MSPLHYTLAVLLSCRSTRRMIAITKSLLMSAGPAVCVHSLGISNERWQQIPPVSIPSVAAATLPHPDASRVCQSMHSLEQEFTSLKPSEFTNGISRNRLSVSPKSNTCFMFLNNWLVEKKKKACSPTNFQDTLLCSRWGWTKALSSCISKCAR